MKNRKLHKVIIGLLMCGFISSIMPSKLVFANREGDLYTNPGQNNNSSGNSSGSNGNTNPNNTGGGGKTGGGGGSTPNNYYNYYTNISVNVGSYNGKTMNYISGSGFYTQNIKTGARDSVDDDTRPEMMTVYNYQAKQESSEFVSQTVVRNYYWTQDYRENEKSAYKREKDWTTDINSTRYTAPKDGYYYFTAVPVVYDKYDKYTRTINVKGLSRDGNVLSNVFQQSGVTPTLNPVRTGNDYQQTWLRKTWEIYLNKGQTIDPVLPVPPGTNPSYPTKDNPNGGGGGGGSNGTTIIREVHGLDTESNLTK